MNSPTGPTLEELRDRVEREWTDEATVGAWRRWREPFAVQSAALTEALLDAALVREGQRVLDLASGAGEPAPLARLVGAGGRVTASDLGPGMLSIVEDAARAAGLQNVDVVIADAHSLPFEDASFDRVISRLGVMFFADVQRALGECRRVLRPDGRIAFLVWGEAQKNEFFFAVLGALGKRVELPQPAPGTPAPGRFAAAGSLSSELERAGFREIVEVRSIVPYPWPGPPEELWQHFREVVAPLRPFIEGLPAGEQDALADEVIERFRESYDGERVALRAEVVVVTAVP